MSQHFLGGLPLPLTARAASSVRGPDSQEFERATEGLYQVGQWRTLTQLRTPSADNGGMKVPSNPLAAYFDLGAQFWLGQSLAARAFGNSAGADMAARLSGASEMLAASSDPNDPNFKRAWNGEDIYVRRGAMPFGLFPKY
jgi:hypothetical protein